MSSWHYYTPMVISDISHFSVVMLCTFILTPFLTLLFDIDFYLASYLIIYFRYLFWHQLQRIFLRYPLWYQCLCIFLTLFTNSWLIFTIVINVRMSDFVRFNIKQINYSLQWKRDQLLATLENEIKLLLISNYKTINF